MKVVCVSTSLTDSQLADLGTTGRAEGSMESYLTIGKEYLVYGLETLIGGDDFPHGVYVWLVPDVGYFLPFRLAYFEIADPRVSKHWHLQLQSSNRLRLFPPSFLEDDYLDLLCTQDEHSEDELRSVLDNFEAVTRELTIESSGV